MPGHKSEAEKEAIFSWVKKLPWQVTAGQVEKLQAHLEMIRSASQRMNLVSAGDLPYLLERHLFDSLSVFLEHEFPLSASVADIGSGAGFPGIPIGIVRPDLAVWLYESRRLKALFLKKAAAELRLSNVVVMHCRWEDDDRLFDIILSRATYDEKTLVKLAGPRLREGGVILYFAKRAKVRRLVPEA